MAKIRPEYEVVNEFSIMANQIINKYPECFHGVDVDKICCVKIINKDRAETNNKIWQLQAVKMPIRLHCPYAYFVTLHSADWDERDETHKLLLIAEILHGIPHDENDEGKVIPFDTKGYGGMYRTFKTIDYLDDPQAPHILNNDINWIKE